MARKPTYEELERILEEKHQRIAELEEYEKFYTIYSSMDDMIFIINMDGTFKHYYHTALNKDLYVPPEKFLGKHLSEVLPPDVAEALQLAINAIKTSGKPQQFDYTLSIKGIKQWFNAKISLYQSRPGEDRELIGVVYNITKRKQAEETLRESEKRYRELSIRDSLTKLYNPKHFFSQLKAETRRAVRYSRPLSLLLLDIDNFKHYNDTYGHLEGDKVLAKTGEVLLESLRKTDSAYRYGGEEFTVILPETGDEEAISVAERIRKRLETETFCPTSDKAVHVTASIGVAQYIFEEEFSAFIKRADNAMYVSKENGKNRVFFSR